VPGRAGGARQSYIALMPLAVLRALGEVRAPAAPQ
jgi:hypothetical protein